MQKDDSNTFLSKEMVDCSISKDFEACSEDEYSRFGSGVIFILQFSMVKD